MAIFVFWPRHCLWEIGIWQVCWLEPVGITLCVKNYLSTETFLGLAQSILGEPLMLDKLNLFLAGPPIQAIQVQCLFFSQVGIKDPWAH